MLLSAKLRRYAKNHPPAYAWAREAEEERQARMAMQAERAADAGTLAAAMAKLEKERNRFLQEVEAEKRRLQRHRDDLDDQATKRVLALNRRAALLDARERKVALAEQELQRPDDGWKMPGPPPVTRYAQPAVVTPGANTPHVRAPAGSRVHTSSRAKPL